MKISNREELDELKETRDTFAVWGYETLLSNELIEKIISILDTEIARQSVTDEDVRDAIINLRDFADDIVHKELGYNQYLYVRGLIDLIDSAEMILTSATCEYCKDGVYYDVLGTPCKYNNCPMCGRRLR